MSSAIIPTSEVSPKSLFGTHLVLSRDAPGEPSKPTTPTKEEQRATDTHKSAWQPHAGGYTPTRPGWHTLRGQVTSPVSKT